MVFPRRALFLVFLIFFVCAVLIGAEEAAPKSRGDYLTIRAAVVGPGDELYLWWGHIGLVIDDSLTGESRFYDWGVFSFENTNFFLNFAFGRLRYSCMASNAEANLAYGIATNRDITLYTLDLPPEKKLELFRFAENNIRPENRDYWYHHFKDNCATRVRDIIDMATDGAFKARYGEAPGRFTLRGHTRRHTWFSPFWDWFLSFLMGQDIDRPTTVWEEMFLPSEIGMRIRDFTWTGPSGEERKLVGAVEVLNRAVGRPAVLEAPPRSWLGELALGCALAAAALFLSLLEKKAPAKSGGAFRARGRTCGLHGCLDAAFGLFFGTAGLLLYFMALFTNHDYTFHNITVLFIHPLLLAAVPLGLCSAFSRDEGRRSRCTLWRKRLWTLVFVAGLLSIVLKAFPFQFQQNQPSLALVLPFALAGSFLPERFFSKPANIIP